MQFTLHAIGDSAFLAAILNSIAMVFRTEDLRVAAGIGALIGLLLQAMKGLMDPGPPSLRSGEFIAATLLWMALFQPTTSLMIEDAYSGEVRVVDHVPLGPAVSGAIISELGYGLTVLFETAFSVPALTQQGYGSALETLTQVRRHLLSRLSLGKALDPTPDSDVATSVSQYVRDCTLTGVDLGAVTLPNLLNSGGLPDAFRFDSEIYTTEIRDGTLPLLVTCAEAWPRLNHLVRDLSLPLLTQHLGLLMSGDFAKDPMAAVQAALDALTSGQQQASDFVLAATMVPLFEQGVLGRHQDSLKATQAAMVETAIAQRNSQWASEQTLFARMVRPMLTWIEGFSYAVTPIMAFTLFLGARGIRMCGQYALMLIWIQFWMPILAIGNLYITLAAQGGFSALAKARFPLDSVAGIYQMDMELQNWLGVGGMLASATPAIALMLVYGGSVTATHFLGRMQGGDFIDEKMASPSLVQSPALIGMESRHRHAPLSGLSMSGAERILPTFSFSQDQGLQEASAESHRERTHTAFMEGIRMQGAKSHARLEEGTHSQMLSERTGSESSATDRFMASTGEDLAERYRESGLSGHDFSTLLGGAISGRYGGLSGGSPDRGLAPDHTSAGLQAQLQDRFHLGEGRAEEIATDLSRKISHDHGFQSGLAQSVAKDAAEGHRISASLGLRSEAIGELGQSAQAAIEAESSYQATTHRGLRTGTEVRIGALEAGQQIMMHPERREALNQALDSVGLRGDAQRLGGEWHQAGLIQNQDQAYAAAGLALLTGHAHPVLHLLTAEESVLSNTLGRTLLGEAIHAPYHPSDLAPSRMAERLRQPETGDLERRVLGSLPENPMDRLGEVTAQVKAAIDQTEHVLHASDRRLSDAADAAFHARQKVETHAERQWDEDRQHAFSKALEHAGGPGSPAEAIDGVSGAFLRASYERLRVLGETGIEAFGRILDESQSEGLSPTETLKKLVKSSPSAIEAELTRWVEGEVQNLKDDLTPAQARYFKAALLESFAGFPVSGDYHNALGDLGPSREALNQEAGAQGSVMAAVLRKIAAGGRRDLVGLIRAYNGRNRKSAP